jgi:uncharacterized protein (DUF885 family)
MLVLPALAAALLSVAQPAPRNPAVLAILDEHDASSQRESPVSASMRGNDTYAHLLSDESPAATARRTRELQDRLTRVNAIDRTSLSEQDALDTDLLTYELSLDLERATLHPEQTPIDSMSGPHIWLPQLADRLPLRTPVQREGYVRRLEAIPTQLAQITEQMRLGMQAGRVPPKILLRRSVAQAREQASDAIITDPTLSPFYKPFATLAQDDPLATRARTAITTGIVPAFANFADFLEREYIPACRDTVGISQGVDGGRAYEIALKNHTTTNLTAQQIHDIGLQQVASLRAEMLATIRETDFDETLGKGLPDDALFKAFIQHHRDLDSNYWSDGETMLRDYRELCKRIDPELPRLFATMPRNPYGVREIPRFAAKTSPVAYYYSGSARAGTPGYFMVNTTNLRQRPKYAAISLTIHEAVPGHHFQIALADELADDGGTIHPFRTQLGYTAFVEGWALYSERLGLEMAGGEIGNALTPASLAPSQRGLYAQPLDNAGRLSDELWRASRLVVDTGLHAFNWPRERAIAYLLDNTAISDLDAASEVDRYIGWPGQACAYKIGQLKILELRQRAVATLADRFDIREFHDVILLGGSLPLPVLEDRVNRWLASKQPARPTPAPNR